MVDSVQLSQLKVPFIFSNTDAWVLSGSQIRACMRNELRGSCGFVRKNFLCLTVSVLFPGFQVVSLFVFLLLYSSHCLYPLFPHTSLLLVPLVLRLCVIVSFNSVLTNSPAFHLLPSLLLILLHLLQVVLPCLFRFGVHFVTFLLTMCYVFRPVSVHKSSEIVSCLRGSSSQICPDAANLVPKKQCLSSYWLLSFIKLDVFVVKFFEI